MTDSIKLIDKYAAMCHAKNDSELARALRVQPSAVNNWRHGRAKPSAEAVEKMCIAINEPLRHWLPLIEAERARTPADKRVWLRLAQAAAAIALVVGVVPGHAAVLSAAHNPGTVYIMSILRRAFRALGTVFAGVRVPRDGTRTWPAPAAA